MTERMIETAELQRALQDALRLNSEFFGHMSHELRTPLNAILGFGELLLEGVGGPLTDTQREYLGEMLENGRRLLALVDSLVELSRLDAGAGEFRAQAFSIGQAIEEACAQVAGEAQRRGIALERALDPSLREVVLDRRRLLQVLQALLGNAVRLCASGRAIRIEAYGLQGALCVTVRAAAAGHADALDRLLGDYPQLDSSAIRRFGSSGLDLVLARRLIEAQSGLFVAEGQPGEGAAFHLRLPGALPGEHPDAHSALG